MPDPIDRDHFAAHFAALPDGQAVGRRCSCTDDPVCRYLVATGQARSPLNSWVAWRETDDRPPVWHDHPAWLQRVIVALDHRTHRVKSDVGGVKEFRPADVTAGEMAELLATVACEGAG